ncbi:MAG: hypothetical protein KKB25_03260 [Nanoarchaeota archaeon]|nr:hypothetical protein [Nanoarchaeota archaeon]
MVYVIESLKKIFGNAKNILDMNFKNYVLPSEEIGGYFTKEEYEKWRKEVLSKPLP